jgi:predicted phosphoribosyltransferase
MATTAPADPAVPGARFTDRRDAGRRLALQMAALRTAEPVVVALPRGGVPVAAEIARALDAPLEVLGVRKLGAPANPEYGVGAIAEDGTRVVDPEAAALLGITNGDLDAVAQRERREIERQLRAYRGDRPAPDLHRRTVVIVDDGAATGLTDAAAIHAIRHQEPRWIVLALPVCSPPALEFLRREADQIFCLRAPQDFRGVSGSYLDFSQVSDPEVIDALRRAAGPTP